MGRIALYDHRLDRHRASWAIRVMPGRRIDRRPDRAGASGNMTSWPPSFGIGASLLPRPESCGCPASQAAAEKTLRTSSAFMMQAPRGSRATTIASYIAGWLAATINPPGSSRSKSRRSVDLHHAEPLGRLPARAVDPGDPAAADPLARAPRQQQRQQRRDQGPDERHQPELGNDEREQQPMTQAGGRRPIRAGQSSATTR